MAEQPLIKPLKPINFHLTKKPMSIQYLILIIWIVAACLVVYYLTYNSVIVELIQSGILPIDLDWTLYLAGILGLFGFVLLMFSPDQA